jgi:hypothetical protein
MMYWAIVAARVRRAWSDLRRHDTEAVLTQFAERFEHSFAGEQTLGGERQRAKRRRPGLPACFACFPTSSSACATYSSQAGRGAPA